MGCGCGGKQWQPETDGQPAQGKPEGQLTGPANPNYTWPPRGNGPAPKKP